MAQAWEGGCRTAAHLIFDDRVTLWNSLALKMQVSIGLFVVVFAEGNASERGDQQFQAEERGFVCVVAGHRLTASVALLACRSTKPKQRAQIHYPRGTPVTLKKWLL